jgi:hypothetical protein
MSRGFSLYARNLRGEELRRPLGWPDPRPGDWSKIPEEVPQATKMPASTANLDVRLLLHPTILLQGINPCKIIG